ncbi:MAG: cobalt ECF transporter T component CbiQ [SAR86 cluster bacterium]|uniref:Cobalt ECF transporter T component CbiQ n=1 Tax=SAR86 cluster bacterium TaxID=2030880 RepID=A0A2A5CHL2_9GAMM|nr:MAG: cobalt ECF transporter T component CbiQ [SAR86 cluster bacterium]
MSGKLNTNVELLIARYQSQNHQSGLHLWDPRLKLALLVVVVAANVVIANFWLSALLLCAAITLLIISRVPSKLFLLFLLAPTLAIVVVIIGFSIGFGATPIASLGPVTFYREGIFQGLSAALRVGSDVAWMALIFLTSHFAGLLRALSWYRVPEILIESLAMMYRYAFLLFEEFKRMSAAIRIRGGYATTSKRIKSTAMVLAQILLRAYDRAAAISLAMQARGAYAVLESGAMLSATQKTSIHHSPILKLDHLKFSYAGTENYQINDVSLEINQGEIVFLCGPNGSGKSTLLKLIAGLLEPASGRITVDGKPINKTTRNLAFESIGMLFQDPNDQLFCTHVEEDIAFGPGNMGISENEVQQRVEEAMALTDIEYLRKRPIHHLSYGEMKRVALAGLVAMDSPILLLDEPASFLDPGAVKDMIKVIKHLNQEHHQTFIIVTHTMDLVAELATKMIILQDGKIVEKGEPRLLLTDLKLLNKTHLDAPLLTQAFYSADNSQTLADDVPLTADEARKIIKKLANINKP